MLEGTFGSGDPDQTATQTSEVDEADIALGYAEPPAPTEPQGTQTSQEDEQVPSGEETTPQAPEGAPGTSTQRTTASGTTEPTPPPQNWEQEKAQMQAAIQQYEGVVGQLLQMIQTNPGAIPGQMAIPGLPNQWPQNQTPPVTPFAQPMTGIPGHHQAPAGFHMPGTAPPAQPALQGAQAQPSATPAAKQMSDEELQEKFWSDPVAAARELINREAQRLVQESVLPLIEQREAFFGQHLGQTVLAPMAQAMAQVQNEIAWRDKMASEYQQVQAREDAAQVLPELRKMIQENPALGAQLRAGQTTLVSLYDQAKARITTAAGQPGKGAAMMPRSGPARVPGGVDNDTLVDAALGPAERGGIWSD